MCLEGIHAGLSLEGRCRTDRIVVAGLAPSCTSTGGGKVQPLSTMTAVELGDIPRSHPYAFAYWSLLDQGMAKIAASYRAEILKVS